MAEKVTNSSKRAAKEKRMAGSARIQCAPDRSLLSHRCKPKIDTDGPIAETRLMNRDTIINRRNSHATTRSLSSAHLDQIVLGRAPWGLAHDDGPTTLSHFAGRLCGRT